MGKIRSHLEEEQINEASCLNLVVNAIILWNTVYMQAIIKQLREEGLPVVIAKKTSNLKI
jgi:TnpA family transposase